MANKIKTLLLSTFYPLAMSTYFMRALSRRDDIDLKLVGVTTGSWIPYMGGITLPAKYAVSPDIPLPFPPGTSQVDYEYVKSQLGDWKPDVIINVDAGVHWKNKPQDGVVVHVATDPHVLNDHYDRPRTYSDFFFNMQHVYLRGKDIYLPYAYDPQVHYEMPEVVRDHDVCMIGLPYENRINLVSALRAEGIRVIFRNDAILDEYREENNRAHIGINWSSLDDLNARAFEIPAMGQIEIMNPVTDAFQDRHRYFSRARFFNNIPEAVGQVKWCLDNLAEAKKEMRVMKNDMAGETYDSRVDYILSTAGMV